MDQLEALGHKLAATDGIRDVVRTMKTLSAASIPGAERTLAATSDFQEMVLDGLQVALRQMPLRAGPKEQSSRHVLEIVFGSDHGLCGSFNAQLADAVAEGRPAGAQTLAVGARVDSLLAARGVEVFRSIRTAASPDGLRGLAWDVLLAIQSELERFGGDLSIATVHNRRSVAGRVGPVRRTLLPLDDELVEEICQRPWPSRAFPVNLISVQDLFAMLIRQHIFIHVFHAGAESLAAEHTARLALMTQAERALDDRLDQLKSTIRQARQAQVTAELLDLIGGFEALRDDAPRTHPEQRSDFDGCQHPMRSNR